MSKAKGVIRLLEENESDADKLADDIRKSILSTFPSSYVNVKFRTTLGSPAVDIFFLLGKDKSEWINGIEHNDPAYTRISVYGIDKEGAINKPLSLNMSTGGSFFVKSTEPHLAYGKVKVPFRKTTGDQAAILKGVKTYFDRLKKSLQDNRDKLTDKHLELIGNKF